MEESWRVQVVCLDERFSGIQSRAHNLYSQFGEDGLIEAVFERISVKNKWCFEVGAWDGDMLSNTRRFREDNWSCLLIESHDERFKQLALLASSRVRCVNEFIGPESLDRLLGDCGAPTDMDFGCIDIDGQDYWVWNGMKKYQPRVMLVEFEPGHVHKIPPLGDMTGQQATFEPIIRLGEQKGYVPIYRTQVNVLFIKETEL